MTGLSQGLYYKFSVLAFNEIGESPISEEVSIIAASVCGIP